METIYIYKLTDPITDEIRYVGKTNNLVRRFSAHINRSKTNNFHSAKWINSLIEKGFKPLISIIEECTEKNWEEREIYWISYYRELFDLTNILDGGGHSATYGRLGKPWSDEHRINNRKSRLGMNVKHTEEGNKKRADGIRRYCDENKKIVLQYDLNGDFVKEWESSIDVENDMGLKYSNINRACKKENYTSGGFMWKYKENNTIFKINKYSKPKSGANKEILQLTKGGDVIKEYESLTVAHTETNILRTSISNCLIGLSKSAGGFKWVYKNSINN